MNMKYVAFCLSAILFASCGSSATIVESPKPDRQIVIDGKQADWMGPRTILADGFTLGVRNDDENLYLSVNISDENLAQAVQIRGLLLWLNEDESGEKMNGVKYPVGRRSSGQAGRQSPQDLDQETRRQMFEESMRRIEFLPDPSRGSEFDSSDLKSIKVAWERNRDELFYEMTIPLRAGEADVFAVGSDPGDELKLLVELPKLQRPEGGGGRRGGGVRGGGGRGGRGGGGRGGRGGGGGRGAVSLEFSKSIVVKLAQ